MFDYRINVSYINDYRIIAKIILIVNFLFFSIVLHRNELSVNPGFLHSGLNESHARNTACSRFVSAEFWQFV